jgi:hypothetical protein
MEDTAVDSLSNLEKTVEFSQDQGRCYERGLGCGVIQPQMVQLILGFSSLIVWRAPLYNGIHNIEETPWKSPEAAACYMGPAACDLFSHIPF